MIPPYLGMPWFGLVWFWSNFLWTRTGTVLKNDLMTQTKLNHYLNQTEPQFRFSCSSVLVWTSSNPFVWRNCVIINLLEQMMIYGLVWSACPCISCDPPPSFPPSEVPSCVAYQPSQSELHPGAPTKDGFNINIIGIESYCKNISWMHEKQFRWPTWMEKQMWWKQEQWGFWLIFPSHQPLQWRKKSPKSPRGWVEWKWQWLCCV